MSVGDGWSREKIDDAVDEPGESYVANGDVRTAEIFDAENDCDEARAGNVRGRP